MEGTTRPSGIDVIGDVPWGAHFGLFYKSRQDLIDILVPYFKAGLENNEYCMWVTAEPLGPDEAKKCMASAMPDFDAYLEKGQIEIIPHTQWYTLDGQFDGDRVLNGWVDKLNMAMERGFSGLRLTGNESWLKRDTWTDFIDYEQAVYDVIDQYNMIALCAYPQDECDANDVLDVASTHQFVLSKRKGEWKLIEDRKHKMAVDALKESEAKRKVTVAVDTERRRLFDMLEKLPAYICLLTPDYHVAFANQAFRKKFGESRGRRCYEYCFNQSQPCEFCEAYDVMKTGKPHRWESYSPDGTVLDAYDFPFVDADGSPMILEMALDITERKQAESELEKYRKHLEDLAQERTQNLEAAKAQAELYVDLMGHDINNLNHTAMGYLELALEALETDKRLKLDDKNLLERPLKAIESSSRLIDNVRKLQRLTTEGIKTRPVDISKVLREIEMESFGQDGRDITVNIQESENSIVEANELLRDVFLNLITNAVKHSDEEKPLTIDVKVRPCQDQDGKYYQCIVEDNGPGIPDELKPRLFHRFTRGTTKAHGKGLGLYLIRTLVEGYRGTVWVEDRVRGDHTKGAQFVVSLPAGECNLKQSVQRTDQVGPLI